MMRDQKRLPDLSVTCAVVAVVDLGDEAVDLAVVALFVFV